MLKMPAIGAELSSSAPPLDAKVAPWMAELLKRPDLIRQLLVKYGSPSHIVMPTEFERNVDDLLKPFQDRKLEGGLFFARKANKLPWFLPLAAKKKIGVDTASLNEVNETLAAGLPPNQIVITAIGKEESLIRQAIAKHCTLIVDCLDEIEQVKAIARSLNLKASIGLRFSGFKVAERKIFSRFGFAIEDVSSVFDAVAAESLLSVGLLHAHLDRYDPSERASAARALLEIVDYGKNRGHSIDAIDLGGGILMRYLKSEEQWSQFSNALLQSVTGQRPPFTYLNDGLGYQNIEGRVIGNADIYPMWNDISKERFLTAVLDDDTSGTPLHKEISDRRLKLFFEPGRALLDNVGITIASVTFRKRDTLGNFLLGIGMNRTNLRPFRAEFCSDPLFVSEAERESTNEGAFLVGNLCSESDLLFRRRIALNRMPLPQDSVAFLNTAGYLAHHMEIGTHGNPLPKNLLLEAETFQVLSVI
jgi:diaminopimelate decarboxylase